MTVRTRGFGGGGGGFTQTVADGLYIPKSLLDAKGDIITATAADTPARLAVGSNSSSLRAYSGATNGLQWTHDAITPIAGSYYGNRITGTSIDGARWDTVGDYAEAPIWLPAGSYDRLSLYAHSGTATWRLMVYDCTSSGRAGSLLVDAGTISVSGAAAHYDATISLTWGGGIVWAAVLVEAQTTAVVVSHNSYNNVQTVPGLPDNRGSGGNSKYQGWYATGVGTGSAPASGAGTTTSYTVPLFWFRAA